ncbi:SDR family NAD(P)-dependent oxidoreductase [Hydrogenophaga electricum]|uniref:2-hydroxycyclohexane-1-carbonyl-CoA dehydrogenase n=1 Tax=Hydrogenophaga electricum TaxID=1230953 RepID=A0ABQ6C927_9BURK|nr:SDR family NAD(P)-dependent oxidoreductase [Hydrogenophaga electricum]GLS16862.1 2-hydroxycyclohexane-1-carbonyl-CoA dehydrogenase [Hydrogenophaga electricum]
MNLPFEGRYAVITGAGSGIGKETARVLAERGAQGLLLADLNLAGATEVAQDVAAATGCTCLPYQLDVARPDQIEAMFAFVAERFGRVDVLVNGAGVCTYLPVEELDAQKWGRVMDINLKGSYLCARSAILQMKRQRSGKIVNIASVAARIGGVASGVDYVASKGGVLSMTYALAKACMGHGINVNGVAPGVIDTPLISGHDYPEGTIIGQPRDVANVIAFLASDDARHVQGCTIDVNGGLYMH